MGFLRIGFCVPENKIFAPRMCFGACEHQHGLPVCDQRGADYAETLAMCRSRNGSQTARIPVPKQGRDRNGSKLAPEPEISGFATVCCAEVLQNRVRMSVCLSVVTKFTSSGKLLCYEIHVCEPFDIGKASKTGSQI